MNSATLVNAARTELQRRCDSGFGAKLASLPRCRTERRVLWRGMLRERNQLPRAVRRQIVRRAWREMCWK